MQTLLVLLTLFQTSHDVASVVQAAPRAGGSESKRVQVTAVRHAGGIGLDGRLDEAAWLSAPPISGFVQSDPVQGAAPTERTEVRVVFDDDALYVGARMYDSAPDSIVARLGRRDAQLESDYFTLYIDPYLDRRSGFYFSITAAGTLADGVLMNDEWNDDTWDGIWQGKASIDEEGWTAELRIPYSQLRFYRREQYVWGINFQRFIARKNERDYLVYTPRNESGFVSRFVDLVGISQIRPRRQVEIMPYVTTRAEYTHPDVNDPFNDGSSYVPGVGADFKVGLSSNLTLDATINPDFGQVEVDPAVVNLSDFETFFEERRPFFIEGASVFNFGRGGSRSNWGFNWGNPDLFYTRRVGRAPQGGMPDEAEFTDRPDVTRILGAAKVTGKLGRGLSVGTVHAVTARESGQVTEAGRDYSLEVEPLTYYGVFRGLKEVQEGRHALGFMSTITARDLAGSRLRDALNGQAFVAGLDGWMFLDRNKKWVVTGWGSLSNVRGTAVRITDLQRNSLHYFQRPDAKHIRVDSSATSLTGFAGRIMLNKQQGNVILNSAIGVISPGYDVNDLGFQWRTDVVNGHVGVGYNWSEPGRFTRNATVIGAAFRSIDFEGNTIWTGIWGLAEVQLLNYYYLSVNAAYNPQTINNRRTRGGPLMLNLPGYEVNLSVNTDRRKPWVFGFQFGTYQAESGSSLYVQPSVEWKPASNVDVTVGPSLYLNNEPAQWVDVYDDPLATATYGQRYVFANLDQVTLSSDIRLNWTFTPQLSFQLFAQPLISAGAYSGYKELARPKSFDFTLYGQGGSTFDAETLTADPDGAGPAPSFQIDNPDFNFKSLRGNAVLRWEYRPGSVLYLVWTQLRSLSDEDGSFRFNRSLNRLWQAEPDNIFMIKLTYWIG